MRGLSEANGSWNTTWTRLRIARSVLRAASSMRSLPSSIVPAEIGCNAEQGHAQRRLARARFADDAERLAAPQLKRSVAHRVEGALVEPAARDREGHADIPGLQQDGRIGRQRLHRALRPAGEQLARVRMLRIVEHRLGRADLDQLALLHHADAMGEAAHQVQVVGDEQQRHAELGLQRVEQRQDLRLDGDVERGRRLVADQKLRLAGQRHGDHGALALAARELMRIAVDASLRLRDAGAPQQLDRAFAGGVLG